MFNPQRHILIAVLGRTPQILTETLYGLCVVRKIPVAGHGKNNIFSIFGSESRIYR